MQPSAPPPPQGPLQAQPMPISYPQPVMTQPMVCNQAVNNTTVSVNAGGTSGPLIRNWHSGLFSCFEDVGDCIWSAFCPCCVAIRISTRLGESCCAPCCVPAWLQTQRAFVRGKFKIQGSLMTDCLTVLCCPLCALCQLSREVGFIEKQVQEKRYQGVV